jgi:signal peptidase II
VRFYPAFFLSLAAAIFALDQWTKSFFRQSEVWPVPGVYQAPQSIVVSDHLWFTYVQNTGALAGIFSAFTPALGLLSLIVSLGIVIYGLRLPKSTHALSYWAMGFLLGGAAGNMWDRLRYGYVVDFLDFRSQGQNMWPVFNLADVAIDIAIILFVIRGIMEFVADRTARQHTDTAPKI